MSGGGGGGHNSDKIGEKNEMGERSVVGERRRGGVGAGGQEKLLRLQVKIMCRSGEICREHFYSFFDYSPSPCTSPRPPPASLSFCLFVCLFLALVL